MSKQEPPPNQMPINLNDIIHVKLTQTGHRLLADYYLEVGLIPPDLQPDDQGRVSFELWLFANIFGPALVHGAVELPCETEAVLEVKIVKDEG